MASPSSPLGGDGGLRAEQAAIVCNYHGGRLAISAVPGSGKTRTLAALAVELIAKHIHTLEAEDGREEREVLIVTFTNSAVENFRARIRAFLRARGLPDGGYRVCTLHSLARLILNENPALANVDSEYAVADELNANATIASATTHYITGAHRSYWLSFLADELLPREREECEDKDWRLATEQLGREVIRLAKNRRVSPQQLQEWLQACSVTDERVEFLRIGAEIYRHYDAVLRATGHLDFDDLIVGALRVLESDPALRQRLGARWPFILEDEAQDSTPLQQAILDLLAQQHGNWVRVGDPNQAIMTTFTASDVRFFRDFCHATGVTFASLSVTGRCAQPIMDLANQLARWAAREHPILEVRQVALDDQVMMRPTPPDDPQQNPDQADIRVLRYERAEQEWAGVARQAIDFVRQAPEATCAILVPTNWLGYKVVEELEAFQRECGLSGLYQEYLRNSRPVRDVAQKLAACVRYCASPADAKWLAELWKELGDFADGQTPNSVAKQKQMKALINSVDVVRLLFPRPDSAEFLPKAVRDKQATAETLEAIQRFGERVRPWVEASVLPLHQFLLLIANDLFAGDEYQLALASSIAASLRTYFNLHPHNATLAHLASLLDDIARNERHYVSEGLQEADFQPQPGRITVTTLHKAKGLEWDRVYVMNVTDAEFPTDPDAGIRGERWFLRDRRDPSTEARVALQALADGTFAQLDAKALIRASRVEYIAERLRLLYVGITRARRDLFFSFSCQNERNKPQQLAQAIQALQQAGLLTTSKDRAAQRQDVAMGVSR